MKNIIDLTYVEYPAEDGLFGLAVAAISLLPIVLFIGLSFVAFFNRDLKYGALCLGLLLSTIGNEIAKKVIRDPRPEQSHKKGYGMPSDHSQFMAFFTAFVFVYFHINRLLNPWFLTLIALSNTVISLLVMYSRIYLGVHTLSQVLVGASIGALLGSVYALTISRLQLTRTFKATQLQVDKIWKEWFVVKRLAD